jgi:Tripartite tricarboxylate transporter TctB family
MSAPTRPRGPLVSIDLLASVTLFLIAAVLLSQTGVETRDWVMPRSLCYLLIGVGLVLLVKGLVRPGDKVPLVPAVARREGLDTAFFMAVAVVYVLAIPTLGFWISSAVVLLVLSLALAERHDLRTVLQSAGTAVGVTAGAYVLMQYVFYVPLPVGSIFG